MSCILLLGLENANGRVLSQHDHLEVLQAATYLCVETVNPTGTPYYSSPNFKRAMPPTYQYPLVQVGDTVLLSEPVAEDDGCVYVVPTHHFRWWLVRSRCNVMSSPTCPHNVQPIAAGTG